MISIRPLTDYAQPQIDFRRRSNLHAPLGNIAFLRLRRTTLMTSANFLSVAWEAASLAGALIRNRWQEPKSIDYKGAIDLVTSVDRECERCIVEVLRNSFPNHSVLAEEETDWVGAEGNHRWIIDPLDGTTNFAHGTRSFAFLLLWNATLRLFSVWFTTPCAMNVSKPPKVKELLSTARPYGSPA